MMESVSGPEGILHGLSMGHRSLTQLKRKIKTQRSYDCDPTDTREISTH